MTTAKLPDPPIVEGTVKRVSANACFVDLGEFGEGRLHKEDSLARERREPLSELPEYRPGKTLRVYLARHREESDDQYWWINERWGHHNPWADLALTAGQEVRGTVSMRGNNGYVVLLDAPDIVAWLPDEKIPRQDGTIDELATDAPAERLTLWIGDRLKAEVAQIFHPPFYPIVSLNAYLARREATQQTEARAQEAPQGGKLEHRIHIAPEDLAALKEHLVAERPLAGQRLLLVDDDRRALAGLATMLRVYGAEVEELLIQASLGEALSRARVLLDWAPFDAALVDYCLPSRGEGLTLACRLHQHQPTLRIALFSGIPLHAADGKRAESCIARVLTRPVTLEAVMELLHDRSSQLPPPQPQPGACLVEPDPLAPAPPPAEVLASYKGSGLAFLVLLHASGPRHLETLHLEGSFPTDPAELERLLTTTDLSPLLAGSIGCFELTAGEGRSNQPLWPFAKHIRFFALTAGEGRPRHLLGLGWNGHSPPLREEELLLLRQRLELSLERDYFDEALRSRLPLLAQGQLLLGLSHEIRGRLSPWVNYQQALGALWQQYRAAQGEEQQALAGEIGTVIQRMGDAQGGLSELIELMLDNRHRHGQRCEAAPLLRQLQALYEPQLRQRGIAMELEADPAITLHLSPLYLFQPVSNLVLNVHKHMHRQNGGWVRIRAGMAGGSLAVEVSDNGPGIASHDQERIFEPGFSRAPDPAERSGLGLYISRLLAHEAGGKLELVESWRGVGSRFRLTLPIVLGG